MTSEAKNQSPYARVMWVGFDQLLATSSNFLVVWLCLTSLPTEAFGSFSYSWNTIALFVVLSRALFGIPALLDSDSSDSTQVVEISSSLTGTLLLGIATAVATFCLYLLGGASENESWIFGLFLLAPLILFQDQIRYLIIATKKIYFAIFLDLLVLGCIAVTVVVAMNSGFVGLNFIFGLASGYLLASLIFVYRVPIDFNLRHLRLFMKLDYQRRSRLVSDALLAWGFGLVAITLIKFATGNFGVATYNGLVFLFGPVALVTVLVTLGLQPEVVRTKGNLAFRHKVLLFILASSPILWMQLVGRAPYEYIEKLLGQSTEEILSNTVPFGIAASLGIGLEVLNLFMRAHKKFAEVAALRFFVGIALTVCIAVSIYSKLGLSTIIWMMVATNCLAVIATSVLLRNDSTNQSA